MDKKDSKAPIPEGPLIKGGDVDKAMAAEFDRLRNELELMRAGRMRRLAEFMKQSKRRILG